MVPNSARDLLKVDPKDPASYASRFSLVHLTAYSVHWLNSWELPSTYENVSVLNARLFPTDFAMQGFPELPDAFRTNRSLLQMRPKYRGFATSDPRKGVFLTDKGRGEVARVIEAVGVPTFEGKPVDVSPLVIPLRAVAKGRERTFNAAQEIEDHRSKILFRRYSEGRLEDTEVVHLLGLLGMYDHTPPDVLRKELKSLRAAAIETRDEEFLSFLGAVEQRFHDYLHRATVVARKA